jgi:hypothetical protein
MIPGSLLPGSQAMRRYALRDDQWDRIKDLLPGRSGHVGVTAIAFEDLNLERSGHSWHEQRIAA